MGWGVLRGIGCVGPRGIGCGEVHQFVGMGGPGGLDDHVAGVVGVHALVAV